MNTYKLNYSINFTEIRDKFFFSICERVNKTLPVIKNRIFLDSCTKYTKLDIKWIIVCKCTYQINWYGYVRKVNMVANNETSLYCAQCLVPRIRIRFHIIVYLQFATLWARVNTWWMSRVYGDNNYLLFYLKPSDYVYTCI